MEKDYSKKSEFAKLEFFQDFGDDIKHYQSLISKNSYRGLENKIFKILKKVESNLKDEIYHKNFNLFFIIKLEMYEVLLPDILFLKCYHDIIKKEKNLKVYLSKNFSFNKQFSFGEEFLKLSNIKFIRKNFEVKYDLNLFKYKRDENFFKIFIKKIVLFKNLFIKNKKNIFIQNQPKILNIIKTLNTNIYTDYLFRDLKNILSLKKGYILFNSEYIENQNKNMFNIKFGKSFDEDLENIFKFFFLKNKDRIISSLNVVIKNFNKYNITTSIIQTYDYSIERIILLYHYNQKSKCYLYNHGILNVNKDRYDISKFLYGYLSWGELDSNLIKRNSKKIEIIKFGNSDIKINSFNSKFDKSIKNVSYLILQNITSFNSERSYEDSLNENIKILSLLLTLGIKKNNIYLKLHPGRSNFKYLKDYFSKFFDKENIYINNNIYDVISSTDIVIGPVSTVFYETLRLKKIYICYQSSQKKTRGSIFSNKEIISAKNILELREILLSIKKYKSTIEKNHHRIIYSLKLNEQIKIIQSISKK